MRPHTFRLFGLRKNIFLQSTVVGLASSPQPGERSSYHTYVCRTESHEKLFLHAAWERQMEESMVVGGTSCYVNLECLVTSIDCIT
jgi:hypothetical protein